VLNNKVILIVGGTGLIGKSIVNACLNNQAKVVVCTRDIGKAKLLFPTASIHFEEFDINDSILMIDAFKNVIVKFGKIDVLINSSFPKNNSFNTKLFEVTYKDFIDNVNIHLGGYFLVSQQISKIFLQQGFGNIINISSIYGVVAPKFDIYSGTNMTSSIEYGLVKSAIIQMARYFASYLKGTNIRINTVSPGGIFDNQDEIFINNYNKKCLNKGMLDANDICGAILFLASDNSKYINGQNIVVDDGFTL
jgi:NAD(P)-dependent dehydrogenase (short-subunit alcohol dehydrogenase family)